MPQPRISIITPSFNQGHYLDECLDSIVSQNYPNLQLIVIDGGSTDNSVEVIKRYVKYIDYWVSEKDKGQSDALNKGLQKVNGGIFNWINSDDVLYPKALSVVAEKFSNPGTIICCGKTRVFGEGREFILSPNVSATDEFRKVIARLPYNQHGTFIKTEIIKSIGGIQQDLHYCMDKGMWIKILDKYGIESIKSTNELLAGFRYQPDSKTATRGILFDTEYANILHLLAKKYKLDDWEKLIENQYEINPNFHYSIEGKFINSTIVEYMISVFLIHKNYLVFSKSDFKRAKSIAQKVSFNENEFESNYANDYRRLISETKFPNWFTYRVNRKINSIITRK